MKKIILTAFILGLTTHAIADVEEERAEWTKEYFAKHGGPVPDGGVQVIPEAKMSQYKIFKAEYARNRRDVAELGYIKKSSPQADLLFKIKKEAAKQFVAQSKDIEKPASANLRHSIAELKMAYTFVGVPQSEVSDVIGVSPYLSYLPNQGWIGATEYFSTNTMGNCSFSENNVRLSHGSVVVAKEIAREDVNGKVTVVTVTGDPSDGFLYEVEWYDQTFFRTLQCANKKFSPYLTEQVIALAKRIDSNQ